MKGLCCVFIFASLLVCGCSITDSDEAEAPKIVNLSITTNGQEVTATFGIEGTFAGYPYLEFINEQTGEYNGSIRITDVNNGIYTAPWQPGVHKGCAAWLFVSYGEGKYLKTKFC